MKSTADNSVADRNRQSEIGNDDLKMFVCFDRIYSLSSPGVVCLMLNPIDLGWIRGRLFEQAAGRSNVWRSQTLFANSVPTNLPGESLADILNDRDFHFWNFQKDLDV